MKKNKMLNFLVVALETCFITGVTLLSAANVSCKISEEGIKLLKGDYESPVLQDYRVEDSRNISLSFSEKVALSSCVVSLLPEEGMEPKVMECENISYNEERTRINVSFFDEMILGKKYELYGVVKDSNGNSLSFAIPFTGFNGRVPKLVMTEIQAKSVSSQTSKEKASGIYRNEYIEFLCLSDGNLSGLEIISGYDGESKKYEFPVLEVHGGEVFVVHLRKRGNGCESEEGDNLNLASASYCTSGIRDLWGTEEGTVLGNKTDVIVVKNQANGQIMDAAFYRESGTENWSKDMETYAVQAFENGLYEGFEVSFASVTDGITDTKTLHRTHSLRLLENYRNGLDISYPLVSDENTWVVGTSSPGSL